MESFNRTTNGRKYCFIEEDDGLASLAEMKAGFSGSNNKNNNYPLVYRRSSSLRTLASFHGVSSPRRFCFDADQQQHQPQPHFLDACFLCKKPLGDGDIFMYRGDTPFCSEECRQEQIDMDEAKEKSWNLSASMKALRKKDKRQSSTSPNKTNPQDHPFRTSTLAAA